MSKYGSIPLGSVKVRETNICPWSAAKTIIYITTTICTVDGYGQRGAGGVSEIIITETSLATAWINCFPLRLGAGVAKWGSPEGVVSRGIPWRDVLGGGRGNQKWGLQTSSGPGLNDFMTNCGATLDQIHPTFATIFALPKRMWPNTFMVIIIGLGRG